MHKNKIVSFLSSTELVPLLGDASTPHFSRSETISFACIYGPCLYYEILTKWYPTVYPEPHASEAPVTLPSMPEWSPLKSTCRCQHRLAPLAGITASPRHLRMRACVAAQRVWPARCSLGCHAIDPALPWAAHGSCASRPLEVSAQCPF
jgi:hypothetical protein